ncbi:hypothetical protein G6F64_002775 [Rhizopus arrhizus]|uniref:Uncharacterized protein n=1 Tax=Rhizopus oryzae TaxID=64495 RepID=A0A9P6XFW2_RHIOR|nr:hypothetical protein G6F64_002775 [Rhizopus arrhizus]
MGLLKLGSFYKKNKNSQQKKTASEQLTQAPALPTLPTLSLDTPITKPLEKEQEQITAGSGGLFDDILAELNSPSSVKDDTLQDFSLALALSQQLELNENKKEEKPKLIVNEKPKVINNQTKKSEPSSSSFLTGDSIYSNYIKNLSAVDNNCTSRETSMFASLINNNNNNTSPTPVIHTTPSTSTPTLRNHSTTLKVLDSDISDSEEEKEEEDEDEEEKGGMTTKGMRPIMERRANDHRLKRKIDTWSNRVDPEANRLESNESMIERMKDRHRNQVKLAAMQRQQDMQNMMMVNMVPQPYVLQSHPGNAMMMDTTNNPAMYNFPTAPPAQDYHVPIPPVDYAPMSQPQQPTRPQQDSIQNNNSSNSSISNTSLNATQTASVQSSSSNSSVGMTTKEEQEEVKKEDLCDGEEADGEISDDDESFKIIQRKKSFTQPKQAEHKMRPSRSTPNLKKNKKKSVSRKNSQDHPTTPSSTTTSDYPLTPPHLQQHQQQPIRHMKSEPELINSRKRQQMYHHQQQLQFEWDRMQAYQREQQLKMMQQQQYMSMYPVMYYNQPMMMSHPPPHPAHPPNNPRMSHSYTFHSTRQ